MEWDFDDEFKEFLWNVGNFLRDKGENNIPELFCAATVAAWSLQYEQEDLKSLIKEFKDTKELLSKYAKFYTELQVLAAQYGRDVLNGTYMGDIDQYLPVNINEMPAYNNGESVNNLLLELHHLEKGDVYVEYGCGSGSSLFKLAREGITAYGVELSSDIVKAAEIKAYWKKMKIKIECADMEKNSTCDISSVTKSTVDAGFTKNSQNFESLLNNKYLQPYKTVLKRGGVRVWGQALIAYQKNKDGRVIALTSASALTNNADKEIRKNLINQGIIEGIIELPVGILPYTGVAPVLVILSKDNRDSIKMMDARDFGDKRSKNIFLDPFEREKLIKMYESGKGKCKVVSVTEIAKNDYMLSANRYLDIDENTLEKGVALLDICDIERGATIRADELAELASDTPTKYQYLMLQDIVDGKIVNRLPYITGIDKKYNAAILKDNDIVISKLTPFKICLVHINDDKEILANGNLFRLTVDPKKMNPVYVMLYLRSEKGQQELSRYVKGTAMRTISIKDLKLVQIPELDMGKQKQIADDYAKLMERLEEIDIERQKIISDIADLI
ncbi:MAG: methyltransferase domain-containing protein [Anaerovibrio sp.]|uniref:N-6 DNA methylase n=1 Tax=Anaerovibrio sp. TaxID=1872532 RepID=UPI0025C5FDC4|nr:N-6 DNA methylase [Anaerovibrio sp.]MBE6100222.1 methyltransferase domain-containing protein [Anaerovibrio sp.]